MVLKPVLSLVAAVLLASAAADPAFAQRGRGGDRNRDRGDHHRDYDRNRNNNWDRNRDRDHDRYYRDNDWNLSFSFGVPYYGDYYRPRDYYYRAPAYYNAWGLGPYECRVSIEYNHWYGRPADIEVRYCADAYGNVYIVQGSQRLYRYRY
jgi:Ni/Co efflux regulator RcnB